MALVLANNSQKCPKMEIIPVKEIFLQKGSLGGANQHTKILHPSDQCICDPQGAERPNFSILHNSHNTNRIKKCFKQKLKSVKFSTKKIPITFFLGATVVAITEQQPNV